LEKIKLQQKNNKKSPLFIRNKGLFEKQISILKLWYCQKLEIARYICVRVNFLNFDYAKRTTRKNCIQRSMVSTKRIQVLQKFKRQFLQKELMNFPSISNNIQKMTIQGEVCWGWWEKEEST
jgi:hypothetical protein